MKRILPFVLVFLFLASCSIADKAAISGKSKSNERQVSSIPEIDQDKVNPELPKTSKEVKNPLTGLYDLKSVDSAKMRPTAIIINNLKASLPQLGISKADIIYEMLAEGGITRLIAVFQDPFEVGKIGTVRSIRPYFIDMAQGHEAILLHFGGSVPAYQAIKKRGLTTLDGIHGYEGTLFLRDRERAKRAGREHSVFTSGAQIKDAYSSIKIRLNKDKASDAFNFCEDSSALSGNPVSQLKIHFSRYASPFFKYDSVNKVFLRFQYEKPHIDAGYGGIQLSFKNVFVIKMNKENVKDSSLGLIDVTTTGKGTGYYLCEGKYIKINWSKKNYDSPLVLFTTDGSPLLVSPGKSFICCVGADTVLDFDKNA